MLQLVDLLKRHRISQRALVRAAAWSEAGLGRLLHQGEYPSRDLPENTQRRVRDALRQLGVSDEAALATAFDEVEIKVATDLGNEPSPDAALGQTPELIQEVAMLIRKQCISPAARDFFGLKPEALMPPWAREQVFMGGEMRVVYEHMLAKAKFGGVLAIAGESGAGKSTLKDLLVTDLAAEGEVVVIEPHTQAMEASDKIGKTLKAGDICEAILAEIAPQTRMKMTMEARLSQVAEALVSSLAAHKGRRHLLVFEEAHALPKPTLRGLKRFMELKNKAVKGLQPPLLSIVLIGQPELTTRLSSFDMEVREVWQRCEMVVLPALNRELEAYIKFRLGAAASAFTPEAIAQLRDKLTAKNGESFLYPLAVDNWLAAILNQAAGLSKTISGETVAEVYADVQKAMRGVLK